MAGNDLWVDTYEPKSLDQIVGQKDLVAAFKSYVKKGFIPNMTISGSPGVGKTLIVKCFAADLGLQKWDPVNLKWIINPGEFYMLNASDERGIDMVRETLKRLARKPTLSGNPRLIFLDEGDDLTKDAQGAMRALIQECSSNARFIICCNYPEKLMDAMISRCSMKEVLPLTKDDVKVVADKICKGEQLTITPDAFDFLYENTRGDLRLFIGKLQDAAMVSNFNIQIQHIMNQDIDLLTARKILELALINYDQARELLITTYLNTRKAGSIIQKLYDATYQTRFSSVMPDNEIIGRRVRDRIAEADYRITQGTNQLIQLDAIINYIALTKYIPLTCSKVK